MLWTRSLVFRDGIYTDWADRILIRKSIPEMTFDT